MDIQSLLNPRPPLTILDPNIPTVSPHITSVPTPPCTPKKRRTPLLTRDQRLQVQTLRDIGWSPGKITRHLRTLNVFCTERQVQYAEKHRLTPQKQRCGSKALFDTPARQRLVDFVTSSRRTRRMPYIEVNEEMGLSVSEITIRRALEKEGFHRRVARKKPYIFEKNRQLRLAWAEEHKNWTREQWDLILWTDETWVTDGKHTRYVRDISKILQS